MTTTKNNEHKKLNFSNEQEQSQACLNSAEHEKNQGRKVLNVPNKQEQNQTCLDSAEREGLSPKGNVPNLRFPEFQGEWEKTKFGDIATGFDYGMNAAAKNYDGVNKYIRITDIDEASSTYTDKDIVSPDGVLTDNYLVNNRDILLARTGASTGKSYLYKKSDGKLYYAGFLIRANVTTHDPYFVFSQLHTHRYWRWVSIMSARSGQPGINSQEYSSFPIYTTSIEEENKIAKLLSLLDERIATQNKIIEDLKKLKAAIIEIEYTPNTKTTSPIGEVIEQISKRNKNNAIKNVLSVSNRQGFIKQSDQFENRNIASEDTSNYKIVEQNDFAFNPARINVGSIARLTTFEKGIVSPMYICFRTQGNVVLEYIDYYFESKHFYCEIQKRLEGSVRQCLSFEGLCNIPLSLPSFEMQQLIGKRLFTLGQKIRMETDLLELLNKQKQYLLRQMFI